jgi:hypothetical protein
MKYVLAWLVFSFCCFAGQQQLVDSILRLEKIHEELSLEIYELKEVVGVCSQPAVVDIELQNLKKEAESYLQADFISYSEKMRGTLETLDRMASLVKGDQRLVCKHNIFIGDGYSEFGFYGYALKAWRAYEHAMANEVLPDGYYEKVLRAEELKENRDAVLSKYFGNDVPGDMAGDANELHILAMQFNDFIDDVKDEDFISWCKLLKDYPWSSKSHIFVLDRFHNILYSSLEGMPAIDKYRDTKGEEFLKNMTLLSENLDYQQTEYFEVALRINNTIVPYGILYTYIPKHQSFIVARLRCSPEE